MGHDFTSDERYQTDHSTSPVIAAKDKRIAELEARLDRIRAEACLCRQDAVRDREAALDRIVRLTKSNW